MPGRIVVDTSALIAMVVGEPEEAWFVQALYAADERVMSAGSVQEFLMVSAMHPRLPRRSTDILAAAWSMVGSLGIDVAPVTGELAVLGAAAVVDFRGSPSRLNFGDGFTYALARALDCPILCKGDDFAATGIAVIRPQ